MKCWLEGLSDCRCSPVSVSLTWPHKHECFSRAMTQKCLNHTQTHARFQFIGKGSCTVRGDTLENHNTCRNTLKGLQGHSGNISPEQPPTGADISQLAQLALQLAIQTGSSEWYRELRSHPFLWISSDFIPEKKNCSRVHTEGQTHLWSCLNCAMNYTCGVCELKRSLSKSTKSLFVISALDYETGWAGPLSVSTSALVATYCSNTVAYRDVFGLMSSCLFLQILWMISFSSVNLCISLGLNIETFWMV